MPAWKRPLTWDTMRRMHFSTARGGFGVAQRQRAMPSSFAPMPSYMLLDRNCSSQQVGQRSAILFPNQSLGSRFRKISTIVDREKSVGEDIYLRALSLTKEADELDKQEEEKRSNMMYEAYQRSKEKELNPKSQGVMVVKTLVKQVRKERTKKDLGSLKREEALELLRRAANDHNHPDAAVQLGNILLKEASRSLNNKAGKMDDGPDPKESVSKAMDLFQKAGDAGSRVGYYNLGHLLWTGFPAQEHAEGDSEELPQKLSDATTIVVPDMEEAMNAFHKAIELGDSDAMYLVGVHYLGEEDVESKRVGFDFIERAGANGHEGALYYLALMHLNGEPLLGLEPCSLEEFVVLLDRAVHAGSVDARFIRGNSFYGGTEGYPQDFKRALDDFLRAADDGHADSAVSAGAMFHNGVGVLKDQRRAFELYQLAGELGSKEGWMNVVDCWQQGLGVPKSEETARYIRETMLKNAS